MPKNLRWKIPLIVILIAISIFSLYPTTDKVYKTEEVKVVDGKVTERSIVKDSIFGFMYGDPIIRETILKKETDGKGSNIVYKKIDYIARGQIKLGLDLMGGSEILYKINVEQGDYHPGLTNEIIEVLEKRIDPRGVSEYRLQQQGVRRILIQVPGATKQEIESLKDRITRLGKLEFKIAAPYDSDEYREAKKGRTVPGYYKHWIKKKKGETSESQDWQLVRNKVEITGEHLSRVYPDRNDLQAVIGFEFDQIGKAKFGRLTERNIGNPMAIILDGILYSAPVIRDRIPGKGIIEGNFTQEEVNDLIAVMRAGSLPADLELEMETTVGPSLGKDSIRKSLYAGMLGGIFVIIFMCVYYFGAGGVATFAFILNILMVVGAMSVLDATLTLPGMAGLVLMIGMAVDANVLIFERIREEGARGKSIKVAIKNGYERAFTTIVDSNVTTLITAFILYAVGTGPVKGFAIVLIVGLLINMFTAVFVTRVVFEIFFNIGLMRKFSMMQFFKNPHTYFTRYRRVTAIASLSLIAIGIAIFVIRGKDCYDIDFTGGTLIHLQLDKPVPVGNVRDKLTVQGYENAEVQSIWSSEAIAKQASDSNEFGIRIKDISKDKIIQKITSDLKKAIDEKSFNNVEFTSASDFHLTLNDSVDEFKIQGLLKKAGYGYEDIISIYPIGKETNKYSIRVSGMANSKKKTKTIDNIRNLLKDNLKTSSIVPSFGEITEELPSVSDAASRTQYRAISSLDVDLNIPVSPTIFMMELNRQGYNNIDVSNREISRRKVVPKKLRIGGPRSVLETLKQMTAPLNIPAITIVDNSSIQIELNGNMPENNLKDMFSGNKELKGLIGEITGIGINTREYTVSMKPLKTAKIQEKIREDVTLSFKNNLFVEKINVTFELINENDTQVNENSVELNMEIDRALSLDKIKAILEIAGYPETLMEIGSGQKKYQSVKLSVDTADLETMKRSIMSAFTIPDPFKKVVSIGSTVAGEMKSRAILALIFACLAIIIYIWFRFGEFKFGVAAVLTLVHDVLITVGAVALADYFANIFGDVKINLPMIAAFLTLIGYSLNDTIVLFDRIRENLSGKQKSLTNDLIDESISQNLNRTVITSLTTFGVVAMLYFFGGTAIHGFAFVMMVGVVVGTYSSIFIASPILLDWDFVKKVFKIIFICMVFPIWIIVRLSRKKPVQQSKQKLSRA